MFVVGDQLHQLYGRLQFLVALTLPEYETIHLVLDTSYDDLRKGQAAEFSAARVTHEFMQGIVPGDIQLIRERHKAIAAYVRKLYTQPKNDRDNRNPS